MIVPPGLNDVAYSVRNKHETGIIVYSTLKRRYHDRLREGNDGLVFIYLKGSFEVTLLRHQARAHHFMRTDLLQSQFNALEEPDETETDVINVDINGSIDQIIAQCVTAISPHTPQTLIRR
ncbi:hypothetical protein OS42_47290 [Dickeya oryzae]